MTPKFSVFPTNALPAKIRNAVHEIELNLSVPPPLVVASALAAVSTACQDTISVRLPLLNTLAPVSLYLLTVADSGERKTTVDRYTSKPILDCEVKHAESYSDGLKHHYMASLVWKTKAKTMLNIIKKKVQKGEKTDDLEQQLLAHNKSKPVRPKAVKLLYGNATPEAFLFGLFANYPSAAIISDEAGAILNGRTLSDLSIFNSLWSGSRVSVERRSSESFVVEDARVTCSFMVQPKSMIKFMESRGEEARGVGFLARFLIAYPMSKQGTRFVEDRELSWQHLPIFQQRVADILEENIPRDPGRERKIIEFTPEARARWIETYNFAESNINVGGLLTDAKDYASKIGENLARIAALFHFFEGHDGAISLDTMNQAITVSNYYVDQFKWLFDKKIEVPVEQADAEELERYFQNNYRVFGIYQVPKNSVLKCGPSKLRVKVKLDAALNWLEQAGRIGYVMNGKTRFIWIHQVPPPLFSASPFNKF